MVICYALFEGIDGSGKSTQVRLVRDALCAMNIDVIRLVEPTKQSPSGQMIRKILSSGKERLSPKKELELFTEDRRWHMEWKVKHAMMLDVVILQDRGYFSTAAYQGSRKMFTVEEIIGMNEKFSIIPNIVLYIDVPVEVALERIMKERQEISQMEKKEHLVNIRNAYEEIYEKHAIDRNIIKVDGEKPVEEITASIVEAIMVMSFKPASSMLDPTSTL